MAAKAKVVGAADKAAPKVRRAGVELDFGVLLDRYHKRIFNVLLRMVGDFHEAADLTQDVFIQAYRGLGGFRGDSDPYTWFYRIAVNRGKNRMKQITRANSVVTRSLDNPVDLEDGLTREVPDSTMAPERVLESEEIEIVVREAIEGLPPDFRLMIKLRDIEGLSYRDIADVIGISLEAVKSRIFRARSELRERLSPYIFGSEHAPRVPKTRRDNSHRSPRKPIGIAVKREVKPVEAAGQISQNGSRSIVRLDTSLVADRGIFVMPPETLRANGADGERHESQPRTHIPSVVVVAERSDPMAEDGEAGQTAVVKKRTNPYLLPATTLPEGFSGSVVGLSAIEVRVAIHILSGVVLTRKGVFCPNMKLLVRRCECEDAPRVVDHSINVLVAEGVLTQQTSGCFSWGEVELVHCRPFTACSDPIQTIKVQVGGPSSKLIRTGEYYNLRTVIAALNRISLVPAATVAGGEAVVSGPLVLKPVEFKPESASEDGADAKRGEVMSETGGTVVETGAATTDGERVLLLIAERIVGRRVKCSPQQFRAALLALSQASPGTLVEIDLNDLAQMCGSNGEGAIKQTLQWLRTEGILDMKGRRVGWGTVICLDAKEATKHAPEDGIYHVVVGCKNGPCFEAGNCYNLEEIVGSGLVDMDRLLDLLTAPDSDPADEQTGDGAADDSDTTPPEEPAAEPTAQAGDEPPAEELEPPAEPPEGGTLPLDEAKSSSLIPTLPRGNGDELARVMQARRSELVIYLSDAAHTQVELVAALNQLELDMAGAIVEVNMVQDNLDKCVATTTT